MTANQCRDVGLMQPKPIKLGGVIGSSAAHWAR